MTVVVKYTMSELEKRKQQYTQKISHGKNNIIRAVYEWVWLAVERQKGRLNVFGDTQTKGNITATMCGVSRSTVYRPGKNSADSETNIGRPLYEKCPHTLTT